MFKCVEMWFLGGNRQVSSRDLGFTFFHPGRGVSAGPLDSVLDPGRAGGALQQQGALEVFPSGFPALGSIWPVGSDAILCLWTGVWVR